MNEIATSDYAFDIDQKLKLLKQQINNSFLTVGHLLHEIKEQRLYEQLDYESFNEYISQPELSLKRSTAYKLMGIYEKLFLELRVSQDRLLPVDWGKLDMIRTSATTENIDELLEKAKSLSRSDLRAEISGEEPTIIIKYCPHCGAEVKQLITEKVSGGISQTSNEG